MPEHPDGCPAGDHPRPAYSGILDDERTETAAAFRDALGAGVNHKVTRPHRPHSQRS